MQLRFKVTDDLSRRVTAVVRILKQDAETLIIRTVRRHTFYAIPAGVHRWNRHCDLPRREYGIVTEAVDLAGNPQDLALPGSLTVKQAWRPAGRRLMGRAVVVLPRSRRPRGRDTMDAVVAATLTWRGWMLAVGFVLVAVLAVLWLFARR